jgi:DME family drug/metabolite transporter
MSALAFAVVAVAGRELGARMHPLRAASFGLVATAATIAVVLVGRFITADSSYPAVRGGPSARDLVLLAYIGVIATGGAYLAFVTGLGRARSATAGLAPTLIEPAVATVLAALVLRERMTALAVAGCLMVVAGMLALSLCERRSRQRSRRADFPVNHGELS